MPEDPTLHELAQTVVAKLTATRKAVATACKELPDLSISYLEETLPTQQEGGLEPYLSALRKAGLPE